MTLGNGQMRIGGNAPVDGTPPTDLTPPDVGHTPRTSVWTPDAKDIADIVALPCVQQCFQDQLDVGTSIDVDLPMGDGQPDLVALPGNQVKALNGAGVMPAADGVIDASRCPPDPTAHSAGPITAGPPLCLLTSAGSRVMVVSHQTGGSDYLTLVYFVLAR